LILSDIFGRNKSSLVLQNFKDMMIRNMKLVIVYCFLLFIIALLTESCQSNKNDKSGNSLILSVFHAGSLSIPMKNLASEFEKENPGVIVHLEAAGSLACIRKITELHQTCDVLALADFNLIDQLMIPDYADWNILFATNELCLVYTDDSNQADQISTKNWYEVLMNPDIHYGRSDPDADPCGYRTILALKLANRFYQGGVDWERLLQKDTRYIRGKETDLNILLESRAIDYMFNYRSVAVQHGYKYLRLPDSINLSNPALNSWYSMSTVEVRGAGPGTTVTQTGASIIYGMTIPSNAPNPKLAKKFVRFITNPEKGMLIIEKSGQNALKPIYSEESNYKEDLRL